MFLAENGSEHGNFWDFNAEWLEQKDNKNILFVTYEDMSEDLGREVKNIAEFLGILLSKEKLNSIVNGSSFNLMRECSYKLHLAHWYRSEFQFHAKGGSRGLEKLFICRTLEGD